VKRKMFALHKDILSDVENVLVGCSAYEKKLPQSPQSPQRGYEGPVHPHR